MSKTPKDINEAGGFDPADTEPVELPEQPKADTSGPSVLPVKLGEFLASAYDRIKKRAGGAEKPIALPGAWSELSDKLGGGLWPGLYVLVGNTGSGKTGFALQAALNAAKQGTPTLYVGLELDELQVTCRLLGQITGIHWSDLYLGRLGGGLFEKTDTRSKLDRGIDELRKLPFSLQMAPPNGWHYKNLATAAKSVREEGKPLFVVLDFLQVIGGEDREDTRTRISRAAYAGRQVARELDAAVLMLSSTARTNYADLTGTGKDNAALGDGDPGRLIGLGKESGDVEYSADAVLVLARDSNESWCAIAKRRTGEPAWVRMVFDGKQGTFKTTRADGREVVAI